MNLELSFSKVQSASRKNAQLPPLENVRVQPNSDGIIDPKDVQKTIALKEKAGFKYQSMSLWGAEEEIEQITVEQAVAFAKLAGRVQPWAKRSTVECADKRTGEMYTRERIRVRDGVVLGGI
jgi:ABC-type histidine transport system ATPase subunit